MILYACENVTLWGFIQSHGLKVKVCGWSCWQMIEYRYAVYTVWESLDNVGVSSYWQLLTSPAKTHLKRPTMSQTPSFSNYFNSLQIIKRGRGRWTSANRGGCIKQNTTDLRTRCLHSLKPQRSRTGTWWPLCFAFTNLKENRKS